MQVVESKGEVHNSTVGKHSLDKKKSLKMYPMNLIEKEILYEDELALDERDAKTPDAWVRRHPEMVRLTGLHPFNAESPASKLMEAGFVTPSSIHYTRNHGEVPRLSWESHRVDVTGDDDAMANGLLPCALTMDELISLPQISLPVTLTCAGNRRKEENLTKRTVGFSWNTTATSTAVWTGVKLRDVLTQLAGFQWPPSEELGDPSEYHVWMVGADELPKGYYGTSLPLGHVMNEANDVILAYKVNGKFLPPDRGYPIRVVVPGWIGGRMVKWLTRLEIRRGESENYYHYFDNRILPSHVTKEIADEEGWWKKSEYLFNELNINSAIMTPFHGDSVRVMPNKKPEAIVPVRGYAYTGGGRKVTRVEVSFDYGLNWHLCSIQRTEKPNVYGRHWCWIFWSYDATVAQIAGHHRMIHCRAWDDANNTQPDRLAWNVMGMGNNHSFGVRVDHLQGDDGWTDLSFVHPTQEAGMSTVGWMTQNHQPVPPSPPIYGLDDNMTESTDFDGGSEVSSSDSEDPAYSDLPVFSSQEVSKHDTTESAWIVVNGLVYDCTKFLDDHPGGASSIVMNAGGDCTEDFEGIHSSKAVAMLQDYLIGRLGIQKVPRGVQILSTIDSSKPILNPKSWVNFRLLAREHLTSTTILLRFGPEKDEGAPQRPLGLPVGMHIMLKVIQDGQITIRAYTPVIMKDKAEGPDEFSLVVKVYKPCERFPEGGKMSQLLEILPINDVIQVKGPCGHIEYQGHGKLNISGQVRKCDKIGFICGGTGLTPAFRVIEAALKNAEDQTHFSLLFANNTVDDILLRDELERMANEFPSRFKLYYTVSSPPENENWKYGAGFVNEDMVREIMPDPSNGSSFVGLCGPPPMIKFACIPNLEKYGYNSSSYDCF